MIGIFSIAFFFFFQMTYNLGCSLDAPEAFARYLYSTSVSYFHMDNWYNSLGINCEAEDYPFMNSICSYIEENIASVAPFTVDILKTGYLNMQVWKYDVDTTDFRNELSEVINGYSLPFWGDFAIDFGPDDDYIIELNFTFLGGFFEVFNWKCNGFRFSSMVFLKQYFYKISGIRQNGRPQCFELLILSFPDVFKQSVRALFQVKKGKVIKASLYKCELDLSYNHDDAIRKFLAD